MYSKWFKTFEICSYYNIAWDSFLIVFNNLFVTFIWIVKWIFHSWKLRSICISKFTWCASAYTQKRNEMCKVMSRELISKNFKWKIYCRIDVVLSPFFRELNGMQYWISMNFYIKSFIDGEFSSDFFAFILNLLINWQTSIFELILLIVFHDVSIISEIRFVQHKLRIKIERNNERTKKIQFQCYMQIVDCYTQIQFIVIASKIQSVQEFRIFGEEYIFSCLNVWVVEILNWNFRENYIPFIYVKEIKKNCKKE